MMNKIKLRAEEIKIDSRHEFCDPTEQGDETLSFLRTRLVVSCLLAVFHIRLAIFLFDGPLRQICLVTDNEDMQVLASVARSFAEPLLHGIKSLLLCDIVHDNHDLRLLVKFVADLHVVGITSQIPNVELELSVSCLLVLHVIV